MPGFTIFGLRAASWPVLDARSPGAPPGAAQVREGCRRLQQLIDSGAFGSGDSGGGAGAAPAVAPNVVSAPGDDSGGGGASSDPGASGGGASVPWEELFGLLAQDRLLECDPAQLPATGYGADFEARVSGICVQVGGVGYGRPGLARLHVLPEAPPLNVAAGCKAGPGRQPGGGGHSPTCPPSGLLCACRAMLAWERLRDASCLSAASSPPLRLPCRASQPVDTPWGPFGTRSKIVLAVWKDGRAELREEYLAGDGSWQRAQHAFRICSCGAGGGGCEADGSGGCGTGCNAHGSAEKPSSNLCRQSEGQDAGQQAKQQAAG